MPELDGFEYTEFPEYENVPAGWYTVAAVESSFDEPQEGMLILRYRFEILDGDYQGQSVSLGFALRHPKDTVVQFGKADLTKLFKGLGLNSAPARSEDIHDMPFRLKLKLSKGKYINLEDAKPSGDVTSSDEVPFA